MIERYGVVYLITNLIDNKQYVGVTSCSLKSRIAGHLSKVNRDKAPLYQAICKDKWENFEVEVIESNVPLKELGTREKYWISFYKTEIPDGYNRRAGGWGYNGNVTTTEIQLVVEMFNAGYTIDNIVFEFGKSRLTISNILHQQGIGREQRLLNNAENRGFTLYSIHPETRELTRYPSIGRAADSIGVTFRSLEEAIEKGWNCKGLYWKFEGELSSEDIATGLYSGILIDRMLEKAQMEGTEVLRFKPSGELDAEFHSFGAAARSVGSKDGPYISRVTKTKKLAYQYYWRTKVSFIEEYCTKLKELPSTKLRRVAERLGVDTEDPREIVDAYIKQRTKK